MSVVDTHSLLLGRDLTEEEYFQSATLGWCTELVSLLAIFCPNYTPKKTKLTSCGLASASSILLGRR